MRRKRIDFPAATPEGGSLQEAPVPATSTAAVAPHLRISAGHVVDRATREETAEVRVILVRMITASWIPTELIGGEIFEQPDLVDVSLPTELRQRVDEARLEFADRPAQSFGLIID